MKKKILTGLSVALILMSTPTMTFAVVDEQGCEWGISDNPIVVGDNSHGAGAGSSRGSSQSNTQISGGTTTPTATIGQETSGSNSGSTSQDNTISGSTTVNTTPGSSSTDYVTSSGSSSSSATNGSSTSSSTTDGNITLGSDGSASLSVNGYNENNSSDPQFTDEKNPTDKTSKDTTTTGNKNVNSNGDGRGEGTGSGTTNHGSDTSTNKNSGEPNVNESPNGSTPNSSAEIGGGNESSIGSVVNHKYTDQYTSGNNYNEDGSVNWNNVPGTVTGVSVNKDGTMTVKVINSTGSISSVTWSDYWTQMFTQTITDKDGNEIIKSTTLTLKEGMLEEWTYLYTAWTMMNETNPESKYYGGFTGVARTRESSAKLWPDVDGRYRVIGTPWFHVRYYKIVEHCDDDGCWDEEVTVGEEILTKAPTEYTVYVPLICQGCPVPVMCINGGCDSSTELNSVSDDAHKPDMDINTWVQLEK